MTEPEPREGLFSALGVTISPDLLIQALTHRSFSHEHPGTSNYERLEFLGDSIVGFNSSATPCWNWYRPRRCSRCIPT